MNDRPPADPPRPRYATRVLRYLRSHIQEMLLPLALLFATEGLLQHFWLGQSLIRTLESAAVTLPALVLLSIAVVNISVAVLRLAVLLLLLGINHAQYTFFAFYGRFLGTGEMRLVTSNSTHELLASLALYFSGAALLAALATTGAYAWIVFRRSASDRSARRVLISSFALVGWCVLVNDALPRQRIYSPVLSLAATNVRLGEELLQDPGTPRPARRPAPAPTGEPPPFDVIYLIGESLRADRIQSNAYSRDVAPNLHSLKLPHVEFTNVVSHGDCTGRSMPYLMVAPSPPLHLDLYRRPTLFAYAKQAGYHTSFVNANENGWQEFVDDNIEVLHRNAQPAAGLDQWTFRSDSEMLPIISEITSAPGRQFLVIETYTGHWPYADRYADCAQCRVYRPDLLGKAVPFSAANRTKITNSYDNAIVYFDRFVAATLRGLKKPTLIVVTSDHGESLGENNMWGHCSGAIEQMLVPLMLIATDADVARAAGFERLAERRNDAIAHENIFPTLLKWFGFEVNSLDFRYAADLYTVTPGANADRRVLTSEIGNGTDPVSFGHVGALGTLSRSDSISPD